MGLSLIWITFCTLLEIIDCWNLTSMGISQRTKIVAAAVWRNRAFLALDLYSENNNNQSVSLVEGNWPERSFLGIISTVKPFPKDIKGPQQAVALEIDSRGRLWVSDYKSKQVLGYDLRKNQKLFVKDLPFGCTGMTVDISNTVWGPRVYLGSPHDSKNLWIYSYKEHRIWPVPLIQNNEGNPTRTFFMHTLLFSRKDELLYTFMPKSDIIYGLNISKIRHLQAPLNDFQITMNSIGISFLGHKLGPSRGALLDTAQGMHYFLPRDGACVRWDTRRRLLAENHDVLLQRSDLDITAFLQDPLYVWAIHRPRKNYSDVDISHCIPLDFHSLIL